MTRVITLDAPLTVISQNFDEAFEGYSNLTARRKKRVVEKNANKEEIIAAKASRKVAKQAAKSAKKVAKSERRQAAQQSRIAKRTAATESRQQHRAIRKTGRVERRAIGQEPEAAVTENGAQQPSDEQLQNQPQAQEQEIQDNTPALDETETTENSNIEEGEEEAGDDENASDEYTDDFSGADGIDYENLGDVNDIYALQPDDFYTYPSGSANPDNTVGLVKAVINPEVKEVAVKSEWNKQMVADKKAQVAAIESKLQAADLTADQKIQLGKKRAELVSEIELHKDRAVSFDGILSEYCSEEYCNANGKKSERKKRKAEVKAAKREARKSRKKALISRMKMKKKPTKVSANLKPEFDTQRIVIPAAELSTGANGETGLIALDDANDFDAPRENEYSNFDGGKGMNTKGILIGLGVAALIIWGAKKAKLF